MKTQINPVTGNPQVVFSAILMSVAPNPLQNSKGTEYWPCTIKFKDANGSEQIVGAVIYDKNYQHGMNAGNAYLTVAEKTDRGVFTQVSHLTSAPRATESMFDFSIKEVKAAA